MNLLFDDKQDAWLLEALKASGTATLPRRELFVRFAGAFPAASGMAYDQFQHHVRYLRSRLTGAYERRQERRRRSRTATSTATATSAYEEEPGPVNGPDDTTDQGHQAPPRQPQEPPPPATRPTSPAHASRRRRYRPQTFNRVFTLEQSAWIRERVLGPTPMAFPDLYVAFHGRFPDTTVTLKQLQSHARYQMQLGRSGRFQEYVATVRSPHAPPLLAEGQRGEEGEEEEEEEEAVEEIVLAETETEEEGEGEEPMGDSGAGQSALSRPRPRPRPVNCNFTVEQSEWIRRWALGPAPPTSVVLHAAFHRRFPEKRLTVRQIDGHARYQVRRAAAAAAKAAGAGAAPRASLAEPTERGGGGRGGGGGGGGDQRARAATAVSPGGAHPRQRTSNTLFTVEQSNWIRERVVPPVLAIPPRPRPPSALLHGAFHRRFPEMQLTVHQIDGHARYQIRRALADRARTQPQDQDLPAETAPPKRTNSQRQLNSLDADHVQFQIKMETAAAATAVLAPRSPPRVVTLASRRPRTPPPLPSSSSSSVLLPPPPVDRAPAPLSRQGRGGDQGMGAVGSPPRVTYSLAPSTASATDRGTHASPDAAAEGLRVRLKIHRPLLRTTGSSPSPSPSRVTPAAATAAAPSAPVPSALMPPSASTRAPAAAQKRPRPPTLDLGAMTGASHRTAAPAGTTATTGPDGRQKKRSKTTESAPRILSLAPPVAASSRAAPSSFPLAPALAMPPAPSSMLTPLSALPTPTAATSEDPVEMARRLGKYAKHLRVAKQRVKDWELRHCVLEQAAGEMRMRLEASDRRILTLEKELRNLRAAQQGPPLTQVVSVPAAAPATAPTGLSASVQPGDEGQGIALTIKVLVDVARNGEHIGQTTRQFGVHEIPAAE